MNLICYCGKSIKIHHHTNNLSLADCKPHTYIDILDNNIIRYYLEFNKKITLNTKHNKTTLTIHGKILNFNHIIPYNHNLFQRLLKLYSFS
jgi:hypothetical protein